MLTHNVTPFLGFRLFSSVVNKLSFRVFHFFSSKHHSIPDKCSQGGLYGFPPSPAKCLCPSTFFLVFFSFQFVPHPKVIDGNFPRTPDEME